MPNNATEIREEIKYYLSRSAHPHLADCLEDLSSETQDAIFNMISDMQRSRRQKEVIALQVSEDVSAALEGKELVFSKEFLNA